MNLNLKLDYGVGPISFLMTENDVKEILGEPEDVIRDNYEDGDFDYTYHYSNGIQIVFNYSIVTLKICHFICPI